MQVVVKTPRIHLKMKGDILAGIIKAFNTICKSLTARMMRPSIVWIPTAIHQNTSPLKFIQIEA